MRNIVPGGTTVVETSVAPTISRSRPTTTAARLYGLTRRRSRTMLLPAPPIFNHQSPITNLQFLMSSVLTFGEIMLRLAAPGQQRIVQATAFEATYAGGEANV